MKKRECERKKKSEREKAETEESMQVSSKIKRNEKCISIVIFFFLLDWTSVYLLNPNDLKDVV